MLLMITKGMRYPKCHIRADVEGRVPFTRRWPLLDEISREKGAWSPVGRAEPLQPNPPSWGPRGIRSFQNRGCSLERQSRRRSRKAANRSSLPYYLLRYHSSAPTGELRDARGRDTSLNSWLHMGERATWRRLQLHRWRL